MARETSRSWDSLRICRDNNPKLHRDNRKKAALFIKNRRFAVSPSGFFFKKCFSTVSLLSIECTHTYSRKRSPFKALRFSCGILHHRLWSRLLALGRHSQLNFHPHFWIFGWWRSVATCWCVANRARAKSVHQNLHGIHPSKPIESRSVKGDANICRAIECELFSIIREWSDDKPSMEQLQCVFLFVFQGVNPAQLVLLLHKTDLCSSS